MENIIKQIKTRGLISLFGNPPEDIIQLMI